MKNYQWSALVDCQQVKYLLNETVKKISFVKNNLVFFCLFVFLIGI